jgi:hypothetical protein
MILTLDGLSRSGDNGPVAREIPPAGLSANTGDIMMAVVRIQARKTRREKYRIMYSHSFFVKEHTVIHLSGMDCGKILIKKSCSLCL